MSSNGPDDPADGDPSEKRIPEGLKSNRAQQLFGHKGGAKPWDAPTPPAPPRSPAPIPPTSSAPYPRDAQYTPRSQPVTETAPEQRPEPPSEPSPEPAGATFLGEVDDEGELTLLHPNYRLLMRVRAVFAALVLMVIAISVETVLSAEVGLPVGVIIAPAAVLALFIAIRMPTARYNARGYQISQDRLRVVRGVMFRSDTIVPFGRVQHIDVDQGPIDRALDIATMTLHTAGSHNASVSLPGLGHDLAIEMREEIRAHIKRESM